MSHFRPLSLARFLAKSAKEGGFKSSGIVFTISRVKHVASAMMIASSKID